MNSIILKGRAKINLTLDVVGKRENGYHDLQMIMQEIWNVNFPPWSAEELRGVPYDRVPGNQMGYHDKVYEATPVDEQSWELEQRLIWKMDHVPGTDLAAVRENYISVGKLRNMVLQG